METGPSHNGVTPAGGESGGHHTVRLRGGQSRARHPAKPMRIKAKLPTSHAQMALIPVLSPCCRTRGSYVEGTGENSSHCSSWNNADDRFGGWPPTAAARSSDFCSTAAFRRASAGFHQPLAGPHRRPPGLKDTAPAPPARPGPAGRADPRVTPLPGNVSGRTDRDNELMTLGTMLPGGSVVERVSRTHVRTRQTGNPRATSRGRRAVAGTVTGGRRPTAAPAPGDLPGRMRCTLGTPGLTCQGTAPQPGRRSLCPRAGTSFRSPIP
jgi:hypothetical protein